MGRPIMPPNVLMFQLDHESNASVTVLMHVASTTAVQKELLLTATASDVIKEQTLTVNVS